jgi:FtsH-binding integral membrane protein
MFLDDLGLVPALWLILGTKPGVDSEKKRMALLATFCGLSGMGLAPLSVYATSVSPLMVPGAFLVTGGIFASMTAGAMLMQRGGALRWGGPLLGGCVGLIGVSILSFFVDWPILHSVWTYGGLALFSAFIAYDTHVMINDYENGMWHR